MSYDFTRPYENPGHKTGTGQSRRSRQRSSYQRDPQSQYEQSPWVGPLPSHPQSTTVSQQHGHQAAYTDLSGEEFPRRPQHPNPNVAVDTVRSSRRHQRTRSLDSAAEYEPEKRGRQPQAYDGPRAPPALYPSQVDREPPVAVAKPARVDRRKRENHERSKPPLSRSASNPTPNTRPSIADSRRPSQSREREVQKNLIIDAQLNQLKAQRKESTSAENHDRKNGAAFLTVINPPFAPAGSPHHPPAPNGQWNSRPNGATGEKSLPPTRRKRRIFVVVVVFVAILAIVIGLAVHFVRKKANDKKAPVVERIVSGGNGTEVKLNEGDGTFIYLNPYGGTWYHDPQDPFHVAAKPNSWTPELNASWTWGKDRVFGVNLGGWLVLEPVITPALFQKYPGAVDEWSLSEAMRADTASGGIGQIETHYQTFITEADLAEIGGSGLNWVRIPIGFWAIETWDGEPFLERVSWMYFLRAVEWCRKYGLRVILDLHTVPGSQNGFPQSGRQGGINFLAGNMGLANAERTLYYIRVLTQFVSQPEYASVVQIIGLVNEPAGYDIGIEPIMSFYLRAYNVVRNVTGFGRGPSIAMSTALLPLADLWNNRQGLSGADRAYMDEHPFLAFGEPNTSPIADNGVDGQPGGIWPRLACDSWSVAFNLSRRANGITIGGAFSGAPNDCGLFLRAVGPSSSHPQCAEYDNWENYNATMKAGIRNFILASFDAIGDFVWWTWKIGPDETGRVAAPLWSYKLGMDNGWIPRDPRESFGKCASLGVAYPDTAFNGVYKSWELGAVPNSGIPYPIRERYPWPPVNMNFTRAQVSVSLLPTYTSTGTVATLPPPTFTYAVPPNVTENLDGWHNHNDTSGAPAPIPGCPYLDPYTAGDFPAIPTAPCS